MNANLTPTPKRPLARHCPELLNRGPTPADLLARFANAGERLARLLSEGCAPLQGSTPPAMQCLPLQECDAATLADMIAPLAGNFLLTASLGAIPLLVSFQAEGVLQLLDRAFGGPGNVPSPLPHEFPFSAGLMLQRLEEVAASALTTVLETEFLAKARSDRFAELPGFAQATRFAVLPIVSAQGKGVNWTVTVAAPLASLEMLFDHGERSPMAHARAHSATGEVFGGVPLTLSAVLVDMHMPVATLSELHPGQILPVSVARSVPLCIGEATVARGTIGALDDRVAVQVTHAF